VWFNGIESSDRGRKKKPFEDCHKYFNVNVLPIARCRFDPRSRNFCRRRLDSR